MLDHGSLSGCRKQFPCGTGDTGWRGEKSEPAGNRDWGWLHPQPGRRPQTGALDPGPWEQESGLGSRASRPRRSSGCRTSGVLGAGLASCPTARLNQAPSWHTPRPPLRPAGWPNWCTLPPESRAADWDGVLEQPGPSSDPAAPPDFRGGPGNPFLGPDATHTRADICSKRLRGPALPPLVPLHDDLPHVLNKGYLSSCPGARALGAHTTGRSEIR